MWVLLLNDMRYSQIEILDAVAKAETKEELLAFLDGEKVEMYRDGQWGKTYKQGGALEWRNPPWNFKDGEHFVNVGTREEWATNAKIRAEERWDNQVAPLPQV